jgi:probable HAF family extracellular repeat protein
MRTKIPLAFLVCAALSVAALAQSSGTSTTFKYVAIDVPGSTFTIAAGINNSGTIVGTYSKTITTLSSGYRGFRLANGHFSTIQVPGAIGTLATGINNFGDIVGTFFTADQHTHGFVLRKNGSLIKFDFPGQKDTQAAAVNDSLTIVGTVGHFAYIFKSGKFQKFSLSSNPNDVTGLSGINSFGAMVGTEFPEGGGNRGFLIKGNDLDFFEPADSADDLAIGINGRGDIVGVGHGIGFLGFNPEAGENSSDSPERIPSRVVIAFPGGKDTVPSSINYQRAIVGNYFDSHDHQHGFLAVPASH